MKIVFTQHAIARMAVRRITESMVQETISDPQRKGIGYKGRQLAFKPFADGTIKVVYRIEGATAVVISVMWE